MGSRFENFLEEEGILAQVKEVTIKRGLAYQDDLEKLIKTVMSIPHKHHIYQFGEYSTEVYLLEDEYSNE